jgi:hypothetical protein
MAHGTLSFPQGSEFDESEWCSTPAPKKQSLRNIMGYAAAAHSTPLLQTERFTTLLN